MPKNKKSKSSRPSASTDGPPASTTKSVSDSPAGESLENAAVPNKEKTSTAASGKFYVIAQASYPKDVPSALALDVVTASEGDLLELFAMHHEWGYGARFRARAGAVNEGVFRLGWVHGVKVAIVDGKRCPVEVNLASAEYGFRMQLGSDLASKLRAKRFLKKIEDASIIWAKLQEKPDTPSAEQEAAAARAAAALEFEDAKERSRRQKVEERRERRLRRPQAPEDETYPPAENVDAAEREDNARVGARRQDPQASSGSSDEDAVMDAQRSRAQERRKAADHKQAISDMSWQAHWEKEAARLEQQMSSSSGVEDSVDDCRRRKPDNHRRATRLQITESLLEAKRSGQLHAIAEEWEKAHTEMESKASDLKALKDRVARSILTAHRGGDLERIAEEMMMQAERKAAEVKELKERVFRALMDIKQSRHWEKPSADMDDAQRELEMKALQLKSLMKRAWKGMLESRRSTELERIADEMADQFQNKAESIGKARQALLRAHRAGELLEIRDELDELADSAPVPLAAKTSEQKDKDNRRWSEYASDSESSFDPKEAARTRLAGPSSGAGDIRRDDRHQDVYQSEADVSASDVDSIAGDPPRTGSQREGEFVR